MVRMSEGGLAGEFIPETYISVTTAGFADVMTGIRRVLCGEAMRES